LKVSCPSQPIVPPYPIGNSKEHICETCTVIGVRLSSLVYVSLRQVVKICG
jgi:hypothetical protein